MADEGQISFLLSDFSTRLRDLEERNRMIRERVLLLGQNLISSREEIEQEITKLKKDSEITRKEIEKMKSLLEGILSEMDGFARKNEMILLERMMKDFQPLEFARITDIERIVEQKLNKEKLIKPNKSKNINKEE